MAWEMRGKHGPYYTRSVRRNGRVEREYYGRGPAAEGMAHLDLLKALDRAQERMRLQRQTGADTAEEALLEELCALTDRAARVALEAAGYHQHKRGEWRRKRG